MIGAGCTASGDDLLTVTVSRDEHGYGMKVSGDNPVYVQSVKEHGAAWRAGLRAGDRILRVDGVPVHNHTHQQVVLMIRANASTVLTVYQNAQRHKTPITAPVPVNPEKQRQLEFTKVNTFRMMLENEQKYINDLRIEVSKVPDVRKQAQLAAAERRAAQLQREVDALRHAQPEEAPASPRGPTTTTSFLSGLPRSLSNLTGQSLRNLRQRQSKQQENQVPEEKRRHNNTVPMVPTTCLDNVTPPPLPPRCLRPQNPLAKPKPSPSHKYQSPMHQSMPSPHYRDDMSAKLRRSSHSLDGSLDGPQPNSIALQMSYPLVNAPPPPLQIDNRTPPIHHARSQSSPEHLDLGMTKSPVNESRASEGWERAPPPGTPPPPYPAQPCADPQRAIISMEEDDSPSSDYSYSGLFSNLRSVRDSYAKSAVLLNWLLGERRCACANLLLLLTDSYRAATGVGVQTLRRWAYEIQSTFLMPNAVLQINGVDENMANEIEHVLSNDYEKEELLRNVFRKARARAKEELATQLAEFQLKRRLGLGALYGPDDAVLEQCDVDKVQEQAVVERLLCGRLRSMASASSGCEAGGCGGRGGQEGHAVLLAAVAAAALGLQCRPASVSAAVGGAIGAGGARGSFLQREKLYKQRLKALAKARPAPWVVRGHHLVAVALTALAHCHACDLPLWGLAPQAHVCQDCALRVHAWCARRVEEPCCLDGEHHEPTRIARLIDRMHAPPSAGQDSNEKKSRKTSTAAHFLNMERISRKAEEDQIIETMATNNNAGETRREGSSEDTAQPDADNDTADSKDANEKDNSTRATSGRGVNRAESCRERDAPRRGKHRNASDPNRLTAHNNHDLEPSAQTVPSGSSSSSSLSSRSNESNTVATEHHASQSDLSEEDEPLAAQWADSVPAHVLDSLHLSASMRKRQEVIHELIVSEGSHVRWLKVLGRVFLRPLEAAPGLLPSEELKALFPNLPSVRERHARLYADLRAARADAPNHVVQLEPVADAILNTLGEQSYAAVLSRFCRGQRAALDSLRERRRKNKDLHAFLSGREQQPLCGRLQIRDLLACVWQRLTKYQLLLESIAATFPKGEGAVSEPGEGRLREALATSKRVVSAVDTAVRTFENLQRLRSIQTKLEVRVPSGEWEWLRNLDVTSKSKTLRHEGELAIRLESNKKISVLALMFEEELVLVQREGDRFLLKPFVQSQLGQQLSPLVTWSTVLFRPNAAVRNAFFLMNINGVQMHELSTATAAEYATWVKLIQEAPLAVPAFSKTADQTGTSISRNPSDASEKSAPELPPRELAPAPPRPPTPPPPATPPAPRTPPPGSDNEGEAVERHKPRRPTVGSISMHEGPDPAALQPPAALHVAPPVALEAHTANTVLTHDERLRRLDGVVAGALAAKAALVEQLLAAPAGHLPLLADLALAETLGDVDIDASLRATRLERSDSVSEEIPSDAPPDLHQLLLAAYAQATQLTELVSRALSVDEAGVIAARSGRCSACCRQRPRDRNDRQSSEVPESPQKEAETCSTENETEPERLFGGELPVALVNDVASADGRSSYAESEEAIHPDLSSELSSSVGAALLATRLRSPLQGLSAALSAALAALPMQRQQMRTMREQLLRDQERGHAYRHRHRTNENQMTDDYLHDDEMDHTIQEQPSNGV